MRQQLRPLGAPNWYIDKSSHWEDIQLSYQVLWLWFMGGGVKNRGERSACYMFTEISSVSVVKTMDINVTLIPFLLYLEPHVRHSYRWRWLKIFSLSWLHLQWHCQPKAATAGAGDGNGGGSRGSMRADNNKPKSGSNSSGNGGGGSGDGGDGDDAMTAATQQPCLLFLISSDLP